MWREILVILIGVWLLAFAFIEVESESADIALTAYTGALMLVLGVGGLWREWQRKKERVVRVDFKAASPAEDSDQS